MTDEDKALVERVAMLPDGNAWPSTVELLCDLRDRIEAQAAEIARLREALSNPPKHKFWGAGEPDCPRELKAGNGELHTLRCKVCGVDNPSAR